MDNSYKKINQKKKFFHIKLYIIFSVSYVYSFQFFKNTFDLIKKKVRNVTFYLNLIVTVIINFHIHFSQKFIKFVKKLYYSFFS